jgi:hypothetical protein
MTGVRFIHYTPYIRHTSGPDLGKPNSDLKQSNSKPGKFNMGLDKSVLERGAITALPIQRIPGGG